MMTSNNQQNRILPLVGTNQESKPLLMICQKASHDHVDHCRDRLFWIEHPFHHVMQIHETFWTSHNFNLNFHLYHHILRNAITTPHRPHLSPPLAVLAQFRLGICEILEAWKHEFSMVLQMVFPTSGSFRVFSMIQNESSGVEWLGWFRTTEVVPFGCSSKSTSSVPIYSISHTSSYDILLVRIIEDLSFCGECCGI